MKSVLTNKINNEEESLYLSYLRTSLNKNRKEYFKLTKKRNITVKDLCLIPFHSTNWRVIKKYNEEQIKNTNEVKDGIMNDKRILFL